jgi:hypothetical protein
MRNLVELIPRGTRNPNLKAYTECVQETWRSRFSGSSVLVVGLAAVAAAFALALLVGWATAGTREQLGHATRVKGSGAAPSVPALRRVTPLPKAPPPRARGASARAAPQVPRLIVGTG